jgi:Arc/MetJ family transcription regulator
MTTTIELDDDLVAAVRARARQEGTTIREVIEAALRQALYGSGDAAPYRLELPVTKGRRPPTIDVDSNAEIDAYLDAHDARG